MSSDRNKQCKQQNLEKRQGSDRRNVSFGYSGPERRSGKDRRK